MEVDLIEPKQITKIVPDVHGGWLVTLSCGHVVWSRKALAKSLMCGLCGQRLVRQIRRLEQKIQRVCAEQAPPGAYIRNVDASPR